MRQELLLYLLQLVQALKYENFDNIQSAFDRQQEQHVTSRFVARSDSIGSSAAAPSGDTTDGSGGTAEGDR